MFSRTDGEISMTVQPQAETLHAFAHDVHSQCGEDGIIAEILRRLPTTDRWAVEFGAWDGVSYSNTAALAERGWSRVLIEGDASRHASLAKRYGADPTQIPVCAMVGWDGPHTLDKILARIEQVPRDFDVLSVDIDGTDYHVWQAVDEYSPKIVVVEFNPTIRNGIEFVQPKDPSIRMSASISSYVGLAHQKGYELAAATEYNAIFVRSDLFHHLGIADNSVDALRTDTSWQTEVFFGFDGHMHRVGGRGLEWHDTELPKDIRLVPRVFDGFPGDFGPGRRVLFKLWRTSRRMRTGRSVRGD